jgi:hypothetical protein
MKTLKAIILTVSKKTSILNTDMWNSFPCRKEISQKLIGRDALSGWNLQGDLLKLKIKNLKRPKSLDGA